MFRPLFAAPLVLAGALVLAPLSALAQVGPQTLQPTSNWAGYVSTNAYYTGVTALIQAPQPDALQTVGVVSSWVGIGGAGSHDLIQAGIQEVNEGPFFAYQAWFEMLPELQRNVVLDIQPGAWVLVDVHETGFDRWQITIVNGTNVFQQSLHYASSHSSAEWVVEEPAVLTGEGIALAPLASVTGANFAKMSATANGHSTTPNWLFPTAVDIVAPNGSAKAVPTGLGPDHASFNVTTLGAGI